jgi:O-6-methylguanine DNA methyltransferase
MNAKTAKIIAELAVSTLDGEFTARYSEKGLAGFDFPSSRAAKSPVKNAVPAPIAGWHRVTRAALKLALAGRAPQTLPPLDISGGTEFQKRVWRALRRIRAGETRSYGEIANSIGQPKAVRAVGGACGANPIPVFIPCHRVLAANQEIGGFSSGLEWKRVLLQREGVTLL